MRIALLQPCYWPEVRRGTERIVHDLGSLLADRGHDVTLITSHPAARTVAVEDGIRVIRTRRPPRPGPLRWYEDHIESAPAMAWHLLRGGYDLAHAFVPSYAWTAVKARRLGGPPVVFSFHGIPERRYLIGRRYRLEMLHATVTGAAATTVLSDAAATVLRRYLFVDPAVLPAGYFRRDFELEVGRSPDPTVVCAASLDVHRKRGDLLLSAFESLRRRRPTVRLVLVTPAGSPPPIPDGELPDGAEWLYAREFDDMVRAYGSAWISVLAAVGEALGLVMIESLAAGTPVVAAQTGAGPEVVRGDSVGRLFEPDNEEDLVRAMDESLDVALEPKTAESCHERAADYEWNRLITGYERLYRSVLEESRQAA
jgi:phosphatidyl-myo-inositol alpha-mannosyltransferase